MMENVGAALQTDRQTGEDGGVYPRRDTHVEVASLVYFHSRTCFISAFITHTDTLCSFLLFFPLPPPSCLV